MFACWNGLQPLVTQFSTMPILHFVWESHAAYNGQSLWIPGLHVHKAQQLVFPDYQQVGDTQQWVAWRTTGISWPPAICHCGQIMQNLSYLHTVNTVLTSSPGSSGRILSAGRFYVIGCGSSGCPPVAGPKLAGFPQGFSPVPGSSGGRGLVAGPSALPSSSPLPASLPSPLPGGQNGCCHVKVTTAGNVPYNPALCQV